MAVTGSQQVMLAVRFAEVQRRLVKELGLNTQVSNSDFVISAGDALLNGVFSATAFATGSASFGIGSVTLDFLFDALEEKGVVKTLARSEEHTSELQSLMRISYAVFCLKKKIRQP